jgi:hypothetical protein
MPIRTENRALYPANWKAIRRAMLERAGNRCENEECGAENHKPHPITNSSVVLAIAHLDHDPRKCDPSNLRAWCQRCHNIVVPEMHMHIWGATAHESHGKRWIGRPGRPQLGPDGRGWRDERTNKILCVPLIQFDDKRTANVFSARVIEALLSRWPHAFDLDQSS